MDDLSPVGVGESFEGYTDRVKEQHDFRFRRKDGSELWAMVSSSPVYDDKGQFVGALGMITDVTRRKRAELTLKKSSEQIKLFAYSVSHDLRSPAIGIYGVTKLLHKKYRDVLDEKAKGYCDQILEGAQQIAELAGDINVYISTQEKPLRAGNVGLDEVLQMVRDEFSAQLDLRQIKWSQPKSSLEIRGDRLSIVRALRNLVDNALKYAGDDLSEIMIGYERSDEFHILSVSDDGVGMLGEDVQEIFGPFQRRKTSTGVQGTGLGLAIVREVAEQHGGKAWFESREGKGTMFYISISRDL
jgi:signal transduction histidine kinase